MKKPKDPEAERRREGMRRFMKSRNLKMKPWADRAGISDGAIRNFLKGITDSMTGATAHLLAEAAGVSDQEIFGGVAPTPEKKVVSTHLADMPPFARSAADFAPSGRDLPILGRVRGGDRGDVLVVDTGEVNGYTMRPHILEGVSDAYAVEVYDTSMEPALKHGWLCWVHPHKPVKPGDDAVIQFKDGHALVKQLVRRTEKEITLRQHNPPKDLKVPRGDVKDIHLIVGSLRVST